MTTSKYELDLRPALLAFQREQLPASQFAALVAHRLDELLRWAKVMGENADADAIEGLWQRFNFMGGDSSATLEELDDALEELYDWADTPSLFDSTGQPRRGQILCRVHNGIEQPSRAE